ncbi:hypothetical protein TYRP_022999 [Tyrophagus putrescentiae]|nr:hypothetical protein TYRP_022999 [Tyrophagus putrescentiae]
MFNAESEDQHDAYYVYAIFNPVNFKKTHLIFLTDFYNDDNIKLFESSIIYIGSGDYARVTEHVVFSKSDCPEIGKGFISDVSSQVAIYNYAS